MGQQYQTRDREPAPDQGEQVGPNPLVTGRASNAARNSFIQSQVNQAYNFGNTSTPKDYSGDYYRMVGSGNYQTYADHTWSSPGRYNRYGQSMLYGSLSEAGVVTEAGHYHGMDGNTIVKSHLVTNYVDTTEGNRFWGGALDTPYGNKGAHEPWYYKVLGEDPYTMSRAVSDGARDQGVGGIKVSAASGDARHMNLFPENMRSSDLTYESHRNYAGGTSTGDLFDPRVKPMVDGSTPNRNRTSAADDAAAHGRGHNAGLYGGLAGAGTSLVSSYLEDGNLSGDDLAQAGGMGLLGAGTAVADDKLTRFLAGADPSSAHLNAASLKSGAIVDAVISGGTSLWQNADAFESGDVTSGQATADVLVDTGVGVASGLAGMAAGAAIGSVIPVAGTAVGAVIGFAAGMAGSWAANALLEGSGLADWAREGLGTFFDDNFSGSLDSAWEAISGAQNAIVDFGTETWEGLKDAGSAGWEMLKDAGSETWKGLTELGSDAWEGLKDAGADTWEGLKDLGSDAWEGLKGAGKETWEGLKDAGSATWEGLKDAGKGAWEGVKDAGKGAWEGIKGAGASAAETVSNLGSAAMGGLKSAGSTIAGWFGW